MPGEIADVQNRKAVKCGLANCLLKLCPEGAGEDIWQNAHKLLHSIAVFNFSNVKTILVHFRVPERNMLIA